MLYEGLRAQKPPLPGKRPGLPPEPEPLGGAVTVGYVAAPAPLLAVPLLASAAGEAVDHSTLQFLLKHAIETKKALEEEERRRKVEEAIARLRAKVDAGEPLSASEHAAWYGTSSSSTGKRRKKKKRKRRKLPKAPLPRCGRPCALQRQVPAVPRISSNDEICGDFYIYFRFKLKGKGRSVQWEVFLFCDKTIKVDRDYAEVLPLGVPLPDIGGVGFGSSPNFVTKHTIYELCLPSERGCVSLSCGGGFCSPDGAYNSIWDSVRPISGKYIVYYFQYQEVVGCICLLNVWFSSNDEVCADNYMYSRFKLQDKCRSEKLEVYVFGDKSIKVDCVCVEVLPRGVPPLRFFTQPGNGSHHLRVVPPSERGMGMSMPLAVPVSSGKYSGTCVSTALLWILTRCPSQPLRQETPSMLLQLSCSRALRRQTALSMRHQCAAWVLASPVV